MKELNFQRANKIVIEATEQSNQLSPPKISEIIKLKDFIKNLPSSAKLLFADVNSKQVLRKEDLVKNDQKIILIGPEGDFTPIERELILRSPNVSSFSISKNILRSDTAVISAISLVNFINDTY